MLNSLVQTEDEKDMSLAAFIRADRPEIVAEWQNFAAQLVSSDQDSSPLALRNHIVQILDFVAADIESPQTKAEEIEKSRGEKPKMVKSQRGGDPRGPSASGRLQSGSDGIGISCAPCVRHEVVASEYGRANTG